MHIYYTLWYFFYFNILKWHSIFVSLRYYSNFVEKMKLGFSSAVSHNTKINRIILFKCFTLLRNFHLYNFNFLKLIHWTFMIFWFIELYLCSFWTDEICLPSLWKSINNSILGLNFIYNALLKEIRLWHQSAFSIV